MYDYCNFLRLVIKLGKVKVYQDICRIYLDEYDF